MPPPATISGRRDDMGEVIRVNLADVKYSANVQGVLSKRIQAKPDDLDLFALRAIAREGRERDLLAFRAGLANVADGVQGAHLWRRPR